MEKLKQLKMWQQQQQDILLHQECEQLLRLQNGQESQQVLLTRKPSENMTEACSHTQPNSNSTLSSPSRFQISSQPQDVTVSNDAKLVEPSDLAANVGMSSTPLSSSNGTDSEASWEAGVDSEHWDDEVSEGGGADGALGNEGIDRGFGYSCEPVSGDPVSMVAMIVS